MMYDKIVTVFGGTGFLGRHLVAALASGGYEVKIVSRRPEIGDQLRVLGRVGQISSVYGDVRNGGASLEKLVDGSYAVINAVGVIGETRGSSLMCINAKSAENVAQAVAKKNTPRFIHISTFAPIKPLGGPPTSLYLRSKYMGENAVRKTVPYATIIRPNIIVGSDGPFFQLLAKMIKTLPIFPLIYCGRIQPVLVGDLAKAIVGAIESDKTPGNTYYAVGDKVYTLRNIVYLMAKSNGVKSEPRIISLGETSTKILSYILNSFIARLFLRVFVGSYKPILTPEQADVLSYDLLVTDKSQNIFSELQIPTSSVALALSESGWF